MYANDDQLLLPRLLAMARLLIFYLMDERREGIVWVYEVKPTRE